MMQFQRRGWYKHKRIGKGKKRMVGWRKPKGRDNKMRENRKGRPPIVSIGYKNKKENKKRVMIYNLNDLENIKKGDVVILGKIGRKNKIEIAKKGQEKGIIFQNINLKKLLKAEKKNELK